MVTNEMLTEVIDSVGSEFDSHEIIRNVTQKNQLAYIKQLYDSRDRVAPFHYVHSKLGKDIKRICTERGYTRASDRNADMFGQSSKCIHWQK